MERKTLFVVIAHLKTKDVKGTAYAHMDVFRQLVPSLRCFITFNNGTEFNCPFIRER